MAFGGKHTPAPSRTAFTVTFKLLRGGGGPCVTVEPSGAVGTVEDLSTYEREELFRHVSSLLRDRTPDPTGAP